MGIGATAGVAAVGGIALNANASSDSKSASSSSAGSLVFDPDAFTKLTKTITDTAGTAHTVVYHFWKAITYVAKPVDATYQSLIVSAPVEIDGKAVDASDAPILFATSVGGYLPASVSTATEVGGGGSAMGGGAAPSGAPTGSTGGSAAPSASASAPGANGNTNATG